METLLEIAQTLAPIVVAILTVPTLNVVKRLAFPDAPAWIKQIAAGLVAFGLTKLGAFLNVSLPTDVTVFTEGDVAAALAAGIAMAIHAGRKPTATGTANLALLLVLGLPLAAACQTGSGTVIVVDRDRIVVTVEPQTFTGFTGDTITFRAVAVDTVSGDTIPSVLQWRSGDDSGVTIDETTGHATLIRAGTFQVFADLVDLVSLVIVREHDDGVWRVAERLDLSLGECLEWNDDGVAGMEGGEPVWLTPPTCGSRAPAEEARLCAYGRDTAGQLWVLPEVEWRSTNPEIASVTSVPGDACGSPSAIEALDVDRAIRSAEGVRRVG